MSTPGFQRFQDRRAAGRVLGSCLRHYARYPGGIVLALPRGGVPVAWEVAREIHLPMDLFFVRKLGLPGQEELAMGAIASGGVRVLNEHIASRASPQAIEQAAQRGLQEIERQDQAYRQGAPALELAGATCILVDDGLATGATMLAAVSALRQLRVARCVVAVPVAPPDTCARVEAAADELICPMRPGNFEAVGQFYADFAQTTDAEVRGCLRTAHVEVELRREATQSRASP